MAHVWACWTGAEHDWHCPRAENDPRVDGRFNSHMETRDGWQATLGHFKVYTEKRA